MQVERILRYALIGGIFLIPFIPFIVSGSMYFPFITGKNFAFRILVELLLGGWVLLALFDARYRPRLSLILGALAAFVSVMFVADLFGENPVKSIWSNFERMEGWVTLIHLFAYFLVAGTVLNTEKLWHRFFQTSVGVSVIIAFYSIFQLAGWLTINQGGVRVDATFGNATYLAVYMLFHIFLTIFLLLWARRQYWLVALYSIALMLQGFILVNTATRGAILGAVGGLVLTGILAALLSQKKTVRRTAGAGILAAIIIAGGLFSVRNTAFVEQLPISRVLNISLEEPTVQSRFMIWGMAWQGFQEKPVLGWGQENFNYVFNKYYNPQMYNQEQWFDRAHNVIFDWLIAGGALGLLTFLAIPLAALFIIWRMPADRFSRTEKSVFTGLIAAYGFHNLFVFDNVFSYILFFTVLAYLHNQWVAGRPQHSRVFSRAVVMRLGVPVVLITTLFTVYMVNVPSIRAAQALIDALNPNRAPARMLETYKQALAIDAPIGTQEIRERLGQAASQVARQQNIPVETKEAFFTATNEEFQKQLMRTPNDARVLLFYGSFLMSYGQIDRAIGALERARDASPDKQTLLFQLGQAYINAGRPEDALAVYKRAYELAPSFERAHFFYALSAAYAHRDELAIRELQKVKGFKNQTTQFIEQLQNGTFNRPPLPTQ